MLARIIDEEPEYDRQGSPSDTWNYWLNVKQKNIWWKELHELDQARGVLPKIKTKKRFEVARSEERILEFMGEGFVGLHVTVETKLEAIGSRMSHIEKNQRILKRRAKKMEDKLTSIESKVEPSHGEDMDFRQWDYEDKKEKENSEADEQDKEDKESESESETDESSNQGDMKEDQEEEVEGKSLKPGSKIRRKVRLMRWNLRLGGEIEKELHHHGNRTEELPHHHVVGLRQWLQETSDKDYGGEPGKGSTEVLGSCIGARRMPLLLYLRRVAPKRKSQAGTFTEGKKRKTKP
ncbi:hypothetical protein Bca52824_077089 [Brassica carinata]|uniref:Uncharacterized protein n=1 Tax=Brassica carinata TaxID=52824 RepID=A0A8X7PU97_BRACI|nr:hypothetical protein Bca52824_077089 [Brassica carinata]